MIDNPQTITDGIVVKVEKKVIVLYECSLSSYHPALSLGINGTFDNVEDFYNNVKQALNDTNMPYWEALSILKKVRRDIGDVND